MTISGTVLKKSYQENDFKDGREEMQLRYSPETEKYILRLEFK